MEYEVRCPLKSQTGAFEVVADGARLVATEPGEADDEVVLVFEAENENATVQLFGPGGTKDIRIATPVE